VGRSAGGAVALVDELLGGTAATGFAAGRPPGHHATRDRAMGFCLFNNVAVAASHALREHGLERVLILDWDVHHGNGTEDLFAASAEVFYVSIHQSRLYPGSGAASDHGTGRGSGFTLNLPVPAGSGDDLFCSLVERRVVPLTEHYEPQLVLISAGYDAHRDDPLASCQMSEEGYGVMTALMRQACDRLSAPLGVVLEGGYALGALARSVAATLVELHPS
jgi:acetoin utilization deacetylase AcuC-like enzyme